VKNIAIPGVFPFVIAVFLTYGAVRAHVVNKRRKGRKSRASQWLCITGAAMFYLIMIFQILESNGISLRG